MNKLNQPSTNFNRVRDGRNAPDAYIEIDLSVISDQFFNIAGNSFYADANPADGSCIVYFQETDNLRGPTPFTVSPGFIANIPFTQIRVVNSVVQAGKKIRLIYGIDTDFQPGSVSQVVTTTNATIQTFGANVFSVGYVPGAFLTQSAFLTNMTGVNAVQQFITPGQNANGLILHNAALFCSPVVGATVNAGMCFKATPPTSPFDGLCPILGSMVGAAGTQSYRDQTAKAWRIPPGLGGWISGNAVNAAGANNAMLTMVIEIL